MLCTGVAPGELARKRRSVSPAGLACRQAARAAQTATGRGECGEADVATPRLDVRLRRIRERGGAVLFGHCCLIPYEQAATRT